MGSGARGVPKRFRGLPKAQRIANQAYLEEDKKLKIPNYSMGIDDKHEAPVEPKPGDPIGQRYYTFNGSEKKWEPRTAGNVAEGQPSLSKLTLFSWNVAPTISFSPKADKSSFKTCWTRMNAALETLEAMANRQQQQLSSATVIFLQGFVDKDLGAIAERP